MDSNFNITNDSAYNTQQNITFFPPFQLSSSILAVVTLFYVVIFIFGVLGNILVIFVVCRNSDMRTSTNYFLVNLSVADLLVLVICMPVALLETYIIDIWVLGEVMCKLVPFLEHTTAQTSVLTLVAIAVERYVAFCHPLKAQYICTTGRTTKICILIWVVAGSFCIPYTQFAVHSQVLTPDGVTFYTCGTYILTREAKAFVILATVLFFGVPFLLLAGLYSAIAHALRISMQSKMSATFVSTHRNDSPRSTNGRATRANYDLMSRRGNEYTRQNSESIETRKAPKSSTNGPLQARRRAVFMLFAVVVVFFVCLLPQRVVTFWFVFDQGSTNRYSYNSIMNLVTFCRIMLYLNSSVNPVLYSILSTKFRSAFLRALGIRQRKCSRSNTAMTTLSVGTSLSKSPLPSRRQQNLYV
ncbi:QRFP-like peptide receptor [Ptychodera flava]|uniref:QRFP-like peptide receptor n=1 Tax=Ptychodera flava TaxID=63121 RepID=UPI00396AAE26